MQSRILILLLLILALAACDAGVSRNIGAEERGIFARQTSDAAGSDANAFEVIAQAERARKTEAAREREQQNAHELEMQSARQTSEAFEAQRADMQKTEDARDRANALTTREAATQKTATAAAQQTTTRIAESVAQQTSVAVIAAANVKATLQAEQLQDEVAKRTEQRQIQAATLDARKQASYVAEMIGVLWMPVTGALLILIVLFFVWKSLRALQHRMEAHNRETEARAMALLPPVMLVIENGRVLGGYLPSPHGWEFQGIDVTEPTAPLQLPPPVAPVTVSPANADILVGTAPANLFYDDLIHLKDLETFTRTILEEMDWSQERWTRKEHNRLPRGYVLSKDTRDAAGQGVYGGYSKLLQKFVDARLIIERGAGATGRWNPNAPRDFDSVWRILNRADPPPPMPPIDQVASPTPTPRARRARKVVPSNPPALSTQSVENAPLS